VYDDPTLSGSSPKSVPPPSLRPPPHDDAEVVARFRAGDRRAFDELVQRHQTSLKRLLLPYVKNEHDAQDVAQKVFVRAFERIDTFRGEASFRTWLYRIAVNLALNHIRGAGPSAFVPLEDVRAFTSSLETAKLVAAEIWRKVGERLDDLPPK